MGGSGPFGEAPAAPTPSPWKTSTCSRSARPPTPSPPARAGRAGSTCSTGTARAPRRALPTRTPTPAAARDRSRAPSAQPGPPPRWTVSRGRVADRVPAPGLPRRHPRRTVAGLSAKPSPRCPTTWRAPGRLLDHTGSTTSLRARRPLRGDVRHPPPVLPLPDLRRLRRHPKRGMALLRFKRHYRAVGLRLTDCELPDHLAVVLEFGATANLTEGRGLLLEHRAGLELLRLRSPTPAPPRGASRPPSAARCRHFEARTATRWPARRRRAAGRGGRTKTFAPPEYLPDTTAAAVTAHSRRRDRHGEPDTVLSVRFPTSASRSSPSGTCGATDTTSSAGPPAPRSSTTPAAALRQPALPLRHPRRLWPRRGPGHPEAWTEAVGISEGLYHATRSAWAPSPASAPSSAWGS